MAPRTTLNGLIPPSNGNVCTVDAVYGHDASASKGGQPFATLAAAIAAASAGDCVWVQPGIYNESITLKAGVSVIGAARRGVVIQQLAATSDVTLVTMGSGTTLANVSLVITSSAHHTLVGVLWPSGSVAGSRIDDAAISIDNSGAGAGTSNLWGVLVEDSSGGTGRQPSICGTTISVASDGDGVKCGLRLSGSTSFTASGIDVSVTTGTNGSPSVTGAEVTGVGARLALVASSISGTSGAIGASASDVAQVDGTLLLQATTLVTATAGGHGFSVAAAGPFVSFATNGNTTSGTNYLYPGTAAASPTEIFVRVPSGGMVRSISVRAATGPGTAHTDTWTVRVNAVDAFSVSLSGADTSASLEASVGSTTPFDLSVRQNVSSGSATTDVVVVVGLY